MNKKGPEEGLEERIRVRLGIDSFVGKDNESLPGVD